MDEIVVCGMMRSDEISRDMALFFCRSLTVYQQSRSSIRALISLVSISLFFLGAPGREPGREERESVPCEP
jgi:hypothetical protein